MIAKRRWTARWALAAVAVGLWLARAPAEGPADRPLRVLLAEAVEDAPGPVLESRDLFPPAGPFESRSTARPPEPEAAAWADAILFHAAGAAARDAEAWSTALGAAVAAGKGLVICGEAGLAFSACDPYSRLCGRARTTDAGRLEEEELVVLVEDQAHPITQCVTHFVHGGRLASLELDAGARSLARWVPRLGAGEPQPALWVPEARGGRVLVTLLDLRNGASRDLARRLALRALEWAAGRPVTVRLEGTFRLLAATLGPAETGARGGEPYRPGFYRGRQIAPVMSHRAADWLVRPEREATEQPERVVECLGLRPGQTVVDLGAGVGYFSLRLARAVGPRGKVLGVDIQPEMLERLKANAAREGLENVVPILGTEGDPKLPERTVDLALLVDVYHELSRPAAILARLRRALTDGGRLVLVEYRGEDPTVPIQPLHRMTREQARAELEAAGFHLVRTESFLPRQHILIFTAAPAPRAGG